MRLTLRLVAVTSTAILEPVPRTSPSTYPATAELRATYVGRQGLYDLAGKAMSITGGTFHEEVEDVLGK